MSSLSLALPVLSILAGNSSPLLAQLPEARRVNQVDVYHGLEVADPYRWLEAMESSETLDWVRAQDEYARSFAAELNHRNLVREQIEVTAGVNRFRAPVKRGGRYFYIESDGSGLGGFRVMMRDGLRVPARELIGYNPKPGRNVSGFVPDPAGRYVAYGTMMGQSRWERWYVRDVALGSDLADEIRGVNRAVSTVVWAPDGSGFYYGRLEEPDSATMLSVSVLPGELYYHRLGSRQIDDTLVFSPESDEWFFTHAVTDDGKFLVVTSRKQSSNNNLVFVKDLTTPRSVFIQLTPEADASYALVGSTESRLLFLTNLDAPNSRVISIDLENPATEEWAEVIPESEDAVDTWIGARAAGDRIVVGYRRDALLVIKLFDLDGLNELELDLPAVGSVWTGLVGRQGENEAFYNLSGFADPGSIYRVDLATGESTLFKRPELDYNPDDIVTRQLFFTSADGTRVPMFVAHRRDLPLDGSRPALMYGYGTFAWAASPWFQPHVAAWLNMGGVYALPNLRGGGEYGEEWHQAGILRNRQNSIDDYVAAAEALIESGLTSADRLVAYGQSAGGPVVAAAAIQRRSLFAAVLLEYPVLDMVRYDRFTGGIRWQSEFGSTDDAEDFRALLDYSPYHNLEEGACYPATLILPGSRDEVAVPMHAYKFAAALQYAQGCGRPALLRVSWGAGHSTGATLDDSIDNWADQIAFISRVLGDKGINFSDVARRTSN